MKKQRYGDRRGKDRRKFEYSIVFPDQRSGNDKRDGFDRRGLLNNKKIRTLL
jgi:hypothetical protein